MRELNFGKNTYTFPDTWEELNREQYLMLIDAIIDYQAGLTNALGCRATWFCNIAGIDTKRRDNKNDQFWENIYRASDLFRFFFELEYTDAKGNVKSLDKLPRDIRDKLRKYPPSELPDEPEYQWAAKLNHRYVIDGVFPKNLLPEINIKGHFYPGYHFHRTGSLVETSLTAGQFISAVTAYNAYVADNTDEHLNKLIQVLYFYEKPAVVAKAVNYASDRVKFGILLNFQAILAFLMNKTRYSIIWNRKENDDTKNKLSIGIADTVYSLEKDGYENIEEANLFKYLDLLLKNIIDSVRMLNENEVDIGEISEKTGLTINQIKKII